MSRIRTVGFGLVRRSVPRTIENLEQMPEVRQRTADLERQLREMRAHTARLAERVAELERSRDETERFGRRIAELTDVVVERLGGPRP